MVTCGQGQLWTKKNLSSSGQLVKSKIFGGVANMWGVSSGPCLEQNRPCDGRG